jgi:four helix bundle protein
MRANSILKTKNFDFAVRVIDLYKYMKKRQDEYVVSQQILKAGTSVGALIREAEFAEKKTDTVLGTNFTLGLWRQMKAFTGFSNYMLQIT